jgi:hypothetical protein
MTGRRRAPHPLVTLAGLCVLLAVVGAGATGAGFCLAWFSDLVFGVKP